MPKHSKASSRKERINYRKQQLHRFLPCFFDVPAADVQEILGISHHTLDPVRRSLGLQKWPFVDVSRNRFCMSAEEIAAMRTRMMPLADEQMQQTLRLMEEKSAECKRFKEEQSRHCMLHNRRRRARKDTENDFKMLEPTEPRTEQLDRLLTANQQLIEEGPSLDELIERHAILPGDTQFWQEISQLLASSLDEPCAEDAQNNLLCF